MKTYVTSAAFLNLYNDVKGGNMKQHRYAQVTFLCTTKLNHEITVWSLETIRPNNLIMVVGFIGANTIYEKIFYKENRSFVRSKEWFKFSSTIS